MSDADVRAALRVLHRNGYNAIALLLEGLPTAREEMQAEFVRADPGPDKLLRIAAAAHRASQELGRRRNNPPHIPVSFREFSGPHLGRMAAMRGHACARCRETAVATRADGLCDACRAQRSLDAAVHDEMLARSTRLE